MFDFIFIYIKEESSTSKQHPLHLAKNEEDLNSIKT